MSWIAEPLAENSKRFHPPPLVARWAWAPTQTATGFPDRLLTEDT